MPWFWYLQFFASSTDDKQQFLNYDIIRQFAKNSAMFLWDTFAQIHTMTMLIFILWHRITKKMYIPIPLRNDEALSFILCHSNESFVLWGVLSFTPLIFIRFHPLFAYNFLVWMSRLCIGLSYYSFLKCFFHHLRIGDIWQITLKMEQNFNENI
jgi:hypothetical protein